MYFGQILKEPAFQPLQDVSVFNQVYIDFGTVSWNDSEIDIGPDYLYNNGITVDSVKPA